MQNINIQPDDQTKFWQIVTDNVTVMLSYWDKNMICRFANNAYCKLFDIEPDDLVNKLTLPVLIGTRYNKIETYVKEVLEGKPQTFEREAIADGGKSGYALVNYFPHIVDGVVEGFISQAADITPLMQMEQELKAKNTMVIEQNTRLLNFANIVSHNLKNHAINLATVLDFYLNAESPEEKEEMMGYLKGVSKGFSNTVDNLNEIVTAQNLVTKKPVTVNLHEYVERSLEILRLEIRSTEAIIRNNVRVDTELRINPAYCESIVLNLLSNTLKYRHPDRAPVVDVNATEQNGFIVLSVKDNGQGIDLDKHGKDLFGMYKTFHGNSDANGIGLFITNFQVQAMGGHIEVESKVNEGSIFKVFFRENQDTDTISTPIRNVVFIQ